jgi:hypothetical protein
VSSEVQPTFLSLAHFIRCQAPSSGESENPCNRKSKAVWDGFNTPDRCMKKITQIKSYYSHTICLFCNILLSFCVFCAGRSSAWGGSACATTEVPTPGSSLSSGRRWLSKMKGTLFVDGKNHLPMRSIECFQGKLVAHLLDKTPLKRLTSSSQ